MIQLRLRTEYSFGQTYAPVDRVIARLKEMGVTAAGIVDVNSTWGHVPWFLACRAAGIEPLLGVELVVSDDDSTATMWFLAKNTAGLSELYQFTSRAHRQSIPTRVGHLPRLYRGDVLAMSDDVFIFAGEVTDEEFLLKVGAIVDTNPASRVLNAKKMAIVESSGLSHVETSDNAYAYESDKEAFEFCSYAGFKTTPQHIIDIQPTKAAKWIARKCAGLELPKTPAIRVKGDLEKLCRDGIKLRKMKWTKGHEQRLRRELDVIREKDFESYFLVVADLVHHAKRHMLVGPSRGSAAGSLVCYTSRITEIDPLPHGLFFERFIDLNRTDLPDIDLDFPDSKRHIVFDYMAKKYGERNTAHIGTVSTFKPRSALIQVCKKLRIPALASYPVKVAMIERSHADSRANNCLEDTFKETEPGRDFVKQYPQVVVAGLLEGHASHVGVHAAGLLVCNDELDKYATVDQNGIAHVDKNSAEYIGLLKIDILGLRTLSVLEDSGLDVDWYHLPFDDAATYSVFNSGKTCGIFQFEGNSMRHISPQVKFKSLGEIDAVTALARPGPFSSGVTKKYLDRHNGLAYKPIHEKVEEIMAETYGLPLYQEHTLSIVRNIGKFTWKETSFVRKAISKRKGTEYFQTFVPMFIEGARSQGIPEDAAKEIWELINAMGAWQMNKAHTRSYAVISYWCAWLKAHHPLEFAAATLRNSKDEDSALQLLREMVREGTVEYVPFNLERSQMDWSVQDGKLYAGWLSLKGIGESKAAKLIAARDAGTLTNKQLAAIEACENPFKDIFPFRSLYGHLYDSPADNGIVGRVDQIIDIPADLPNGEERVFLGELMHKNARNANESVNVKKRGGKLETGPLDYVDVWLRDDTDMIGGRVGRHDYLRIGRELLEKVPLGAKLLVRAKFWNGYRYAFITKWRRLDV